ncbi:biosynthetic-type acetolactate synthase large subunit [Oscillospiraceae bacterium Marseille-Q3528]|nr:biosynthetic-type acetolactate synthase large subunit [Oscillospiraceae bacterium Marseille-Q3528]WNV59586.1 biosynthetic-type acetolactate synthase large subunit [Oscillospiraceae bacterium NTUH-002-81]
MTGADAMVKCLENEGISVVYGYPGVAICPFFNSILDSDIESVLVRTEQNGGHMASGYARVTGKAGVCVSTSGPGATNLITGIATAYMDSIPMVAITGQVNTAQLGKDVFQEADITGAVESFVKYSYIVKNVEDIPRVFKEAFYIANTGRRGPVLIDVPIDVQNAKFDFSYPESVSLRTYKPTVKGHIIQIKKVIAELSKAKMPLICVGGGVLLSEARDEVRAFAEKYQIPVVSTMMGISTMPTEHPLYFGMVGNNGKAYANRAMNECDLLIVMGARLADRAIQQLNMNALAEERTVVHIDVDPAEIGKIMGPTIPIVGDIRHIMNDFAKQDFENDFSDWLQLLNMWKKEMAPKRRPNPEYVDPAEFIRILSEKLDDDAIYVADVGQNQIWSAGYHIVKNGRFLTSGGMGTMGYSIPAAIGAKRADMNRQVIAVCGDGSFQMSFMELATMQQHHIPIKIVVLKNNFLGMVREYQHYTYHDRYSVVNLDGSPDLEKIAAAYDIPFARLYNMDGVEEKLDAFLKQEGPGLMECVIDQYDLVK